jgi:tetratricopeptide (TPR) repeat protein
MPAFPSHVAQPVAPVVDRAEETSIVGISSWMKAVFRGKALDRALEKHRSQIGDLFAEINACLGDGKPAEAEAACRRLASLLAELPVAEAGDDSRYLLGAMLFDLGSSYRMLRNREEAEKTYGRAMELWQEVAAAKPDNTHVAGCIAGCKNHLGLLYQDAGSLQQAASLYGEALALREKLFASDPGDEENRVYLGGTLCNLANLAMAQDNFQESLRWYNQSIDILDQSIPGCDCGCRDMSANMIAHLTGRPSPLLVAQQFLRNALAGRASLFATQGHGLRYRQVRCLDRDQGTVISILTERLVAQRAGSPGQDASLYELKRELLDAVMSARGSVILDLQAVKELDAEGVAILLHLRGRLVGSGEWPLLSGLSDSLRAATPSVSWDERFRCYASADAAVADLQGSAGES